MNQDRARLPQPSNSSSSFPSAATSGITIAGRSSSSRSLHGSSGMSSAFLGQSSSSAHTHRHFSPSLYPPPSPSPSRRGFAASHASGSASSSRFHQIPPSPGQQCSQRTHSQPSTLLSELISIRRTGANLFGNLMNDPVPAAETATLSNALRSTPHVQQQEQSTMSLPTRTPIASGSLMFSAGFAPPASQHSSTMSDPSSWSADLATGGAMYGPSSDSELPPLPPNLQTSHYDLPPSGQLMQNNGTSTVTEPAVVQQPSSDLEMHESESSLAPLPQNLQMPPPLLQVTQEQQHVDAPPAQCLEPETISVDNDEDGLSAMLHSFVESSHKPASLPWLEPATLDGDRVQQAGSSGNTTACAAVDGGSKTWEAMPPPASMYDKMDNGASSSSGGGSSIPWSSHSSASMYTQPQAPPPQHPGSSHGPSVWSSTAGISGQGLQAMPPMGSNFDMTSISGQGWPAIGSSSSSTSTRASIMPWSYSSPSAVGNSTPVPKLLLGGLPPRPLTLGAGCSSSLSTSQRGANGVVFSEAEVDIIKKDKQLNDLVNTDPKRVKRIVKNRVSFTNYRVQKKKYVQGLQHRVEALETECASLSAQISSHQELFSNLMTQNREMQAKLQGLNELANLEDALNTQLRSEIEGLKLNNLNILHVNGMHNPMASQMEAQNHWSADGISNELLVASHMNDASGSHPPPTQEQTPQP